MEERAQILLSINELKIKIKEEKLKRIHMIAELEKLQKQNLVHVKIFKARKYLSAIANFFLQLITDT